MVRSRGHSEYMEPTGRRAHRRRSWLRTARLNLVGWAALLGVCLLTAAAGLAASAATRAPLPLGAAFGVAPLLVVFLLDRRRWSRMPTTFNWGGSVPDVAQIVADLDARGVRAYVVTQETATAWGDSTHRHTSSPDAKEAGLEYANRDAKVVDAVLRRRGVQPPDRL